MRLAWSTDGGATFGDAVDVDRDGSCGYVDVELAATGDAIVSWWRRHQPGEIELVLQRVGADGTTSDRQVVATAAVAQPLDMPQLELTADGAIVAWTDPNDERVRARRVALP